MPVRLREAFEQRRNGKDWTTPDGTEKHALANPSGMEIRRRRGEVFFERNGTDRSSQTRMGQRRSRKRKSICCLSHTGGRQTYEGERTRQMGGTNLSNARSKQSSERDAVSTGPRGKQRKGRLMREGMNTFEKR